MSEITLLPIERDFLASPAIKAALNLNDIRRGQRNIGNAQKRKFASTIQLSAHVVAAYDWFKSPEGQEAFREQGLSWTIDDFSLKVFGWQKSYMHKVRKAGMLDARIIEAFVTKCMEIGDDALQTLAGLLEFSRDIDVDSLDADATDEEVAEAVEEVEVAQREESTTIITLSFRNPDGDNVAFRMDADGSFNTSNSKEEIVSVLAVINAAIDACV